MFSKPKHGWVDIVIGDFIGRGSYLTDIPMDFLKSAKFSLTHNVPLSLFVDEEGTELLIVSFHGGTAITRFGDENKTYYSDKSHLQLIEEGLSDIFTNISDWAKFMADDEWDDAVNRGKMHIQDLCGDIRVLLM